jgi:hypothetical protein
MGRVITVYTDIGHDDPRDLLWLFTGGQVDHVRSGQTFTHEIIYGTVETDNHWRGRFEVATGFCSIAAPIDQEGLMPPKGLLQLLRDAFPVTKFHYFTSREHTAISSNPGVW